MSKKNDFINDMLRAGRNSGGSRKTQHDRQNKLTAFCEWLWRNGYQLLSPQNVRVRHIAEYTATRLSDSINLRTLQNDMAAIRVALRGAGRGVFASSIELTNKALLIAGASRKGTKRPISDPEFCGIYDRALIFDAGLAAVLGLERRIGLRGRESVMAAPSLPDWCKFLSEGATKIRIAHGTKGGRPRDVTLHRREEAIEAIHFAREIAKQRNGVLIIAPNLASALGYYHRHSHDLGLKGEIAPHSLRYAFAVDAVTSYVQAGYSMREAVALAAQDLGHGSGRGRLIREIYGRGVLPNNIPDKK